VKTNIKVLFYHTNPNGDTFIDKTIKWWTNSKYYHTEIIINNEYLVGAQAGEGVYIKDVIDNSKYYDIVNMDIHSTSTQLSIIKDWINGVIGSKYDYLGIILSQIFPTRIDSPNRWFCSELSTKILQLLVVKQVISLTPNMVSPGNLYNLISKKL